MAVTAVVPALVNRIFGSYVKQVPRASIPHVPFSNDPSAPLTPAPSPTAPSPAPTRAAVSVIEALLLAAFILVALYFARIVLLPLAIALSLNFLLSPAVSQIERLRIRRIPAVLLVIIMVFALAGGVGWIVTRQVIAVINDLPNYRQNIQEKITSVHAPTSGPLGRAFQSIRELGADISSVTNPTPPQPPPPRTRRERERQRLQQATEPVPVRVVPQQPSASQYLSQFALPLLEPIGMLIMVLIFTFYMLVKHENLRNRLLLLAGRGRLTLMTQAMNEAAGRISRYLVLNVLVNAAYGVVFGVSLYLLHVPNATLWGALMGILRMVPYAGTLAAGISTIIFTLAVFPGWLHALWVALLFAGLELVVANFIEPHIYGRGTGVSAFALIVMAIVWTLLWGWPGLIVSTPLTVCLIVMGRHIPQMSFLNILLGEDAELSPEAHFYERLLAMDQSDAHQIAIHYLEEHTLLELYDHVILPALILGEQDRHKGALDGVHRSWLYRSVAELLAEFADFQRPPAEGPEEPGSAPAPPIHPVICIPAEDEADELAATMLAQTLEQLGYGTMLLPTASLTPEILSRLAEDAETILCISAVPPFAFAQARKLAQSLRDNLPRNPVLVGFWGGDGDQATLRARFGNARPNSVVATLDAAIWRIREMTAQPESPALN